MTDIRPTTLPDAAVMRALPGVRALNTPLEVTETAPGLLEVQVSPDCSTLELPSEYVPVAVKTWVGPIGKNRVSGVRLRAVNVATELPESPPLWLELLPQPERAMLAAKKPAANS